MRRSALSPDLIVILSGVTAALYVGKLPPALPVLRDALGITLLQAGFLLSLVQLAGMTLGLAVGLRRRWQRGRHLDLAAPGRRRWRRRGLNDLGTASAALRGLVRKAAPGRADQRRRHQHQVEREPGAQARFSARMTV